MSCDSLFDECNLMITQPQNLHRILQSHTKMEVWDLLSSTTALQFGLTQSIKHADPGHLLNLADMVSTLLPDVYTFPHAPVAEICCFRLLEDTVLTFVESCLSAEKRRWLRSVVRLVDFLENVTYEPAPNIAMRLFKIFCHSPEHELVTGLLTRLSLISTCLEDFGLQVSTKMSSHWVRYLLHICSHTTKEEIRRLFINQNFVSCWNKLFRSRNSVMMHTKAMYCSIAVKVLKQAYNSEFLQQLWLETDTESLRDWLTLCFLWTRRSPVMMRSCSSHDRF